MDRELFSTSRHWKSGSLLASFTAFPFGDPDRRWDPPGSSAFLTRAPPTLAYFSSFLFQSTARFLIIKTCFTSKTS